MKLTKQDIINFCEDCEKGLGNRVLAKKYNISERVALNMKNRYILHGISNLLHKPNNNNYPPTLKKSICDRILNGESKSSIATELGVHAGTIYSWFKKYQEKGYNGFIDKRGRPRKTNMPKKKDIKAPLTDLEREELNALRERNKELEMELEITKKLNALVQERIKRETQKK